MNSFTHTITSMTKTVFCIMKNISYVFSFVICLYELKKLKVWSSLRTPWHISCTKTNTLCILWNTFQKQEELTFSINIFLLFIAHKFRIVNRWKGKPSGSIACTRKEFLCLIKEIKNSPHISKAFKVLFCFEMFMLINYLGIQLYKVALPIQYELRPLISVMNQHLFNARMQPLRRSCFTLLFCQHVAKMYEGPTIIVTKIIRSKCWCFSTLNTCKNNVSCIVSLT